VLTLRGVRCCSVTFDFQSGPLTFTVAYPLEQSTKRLATLIARSSPRAVRVSVPALLRDPRGSVHEVVVATDLATLRQVIVWIDNGREAIHPPHVIVRGMDRLRESLGVESTQFVAIEDPPQNKT